MTNNRSVVLSLSGGMDSSTLLLRCLKEYKTVTAISFDYGQKHRVELERAVNMVKYVNENSIGGNMNGNYKPFAHQIIELRGLSSLLNSNLVEGGKEVPEGHYEQENMKDTVVPNRNKIFSSIIQAVALSIANETGENCDIALGIHAGDHAIYPDCRQDFRDADFEAFRIGNWGSEKVGHFTPYLNGDKFEILKDGEQLCRELGLDFNAVYSRTNTSYKPLYFDWQRLSSMGIKIAPEYIQSSLGKVSAYKQGLWYSDYKSASSVERIEAFIKLGRPDPVAYADETGPVSWEVAKSHVEKILAEANN